MPDTLSDAVEPVAKSAGSQNTAFSEESPVPGKSAVPSSGLPALHEKDAAPVDGTLTTSPETGVSFRQRARTRCSS